MHFTRHPLPARFVSRLFVAVLVLAVAPVTVSAAKNEDGRGQSTDAPGRGGDSPGQSEDAPGRGGDAPGNSENAPGKNKGGGGGGGGGGPLSTLNRYQMANQCWAIYSHEAKAYLQGGQNGYTATAAKPAEAEPFYLKPTALGKYLLFPTNRQLLTITAAAGGIGGVPTERANDLAEWTIKVVGDTTDYPPTPAYHQEPTPAAVAHYLQFRDGGDPNLQADAFSIAPTALTSEGTPDEFRQNGGDQLGAQLALGPQGYLTLGPAGDSAGFGFAPLDPGACAHFPEAESNFTGTPFKGSPGQPVKGHVDAHVHISATEFLGGAEHGRPYHKFGVQHALPNCEQTHGPQGSRDLVGNLFTMDTDGHDTAGYPHFNEWPAARMLTHEAIYWKWLERSWAGGLRVIVNDLVDNQTLCEIQSANSNQPVQNCNEMDNAGRQAGTMYGMMDYIDAQYGGRGEGFFQIVHDSARAREVIEDGKAAVILGIEISNLFDCTVNYNPARQLPPHKEPMTVTEAEGMGMLLENRYGCSPESLDLSMQRAWGWGVRQLITIHEFDNAFGGNGIFDGLVLNLGNRENSGANPTGDMMQVVQHLSRGGDPAEVQHLIGNYAVSEAPTGEWWTTYDCPVEGSKGYTDTFSGYLWSGSGGSTQEYLATPYCSPTGQDGRWGGTTPCYPTGQSDGAPAEFRSGFQEFKKNIQPLFGAFNISEPEVTNNRQCNARWMTPIGLYAYKNIMKHGFIFDWDHLEMGMKSQLLDLAEAQATLPGGVTYPLVSTHGTFGGTTIDQAYRMLAGGGVMYPSIGSASGFLKDMQEAVRVHKGTEGALVRDKRSPVSHLFGFGYGTDTNGLSAQVGPGGSKVTYPFTLYDGGDWTSVGINNPVEFQQPISTDATGNKAREWHQNVDGNAHHGMIADVVKQIENDGTATELGHLFNSAEVYLQMWARTEQSSAAIRAAGGAAGESSLILRPAPGGSSDDLDRRGKPAY